MKPGKFTLYIIAPLLCLIGFLPACEEKEPQPATMKEMVDQIVFPHIALGSNVGVIVGIIKDGEKTVYSYGEKELGSREKLTTQSVFEIASLTKTFTALALADMHLKGEVNLDDPIENYLPSSIKIPSRNGKKITLRQLANHTSGLPRLPSNIEEEAYNPYREYTEEKMYTFLNNYTLKRDPGSEFEYSNVGYGLLGHIMSLQNNSTYESVITSHILKPLGMSHSFVTANEPLLQNQVQGHYGNRKVESWAKYMQNITQGTGSLSADLNDMLLYLEANIEVTNTPLQEAISLTHQHTFKMEGYNQDGIGLAWYFHTTNGDQIIWKNGGNDGFTSFMGFNKAKKTGVVLLLNSSLNPDLFQTQMGFDILKKLK